MEGDALRGGGSRVVGAGGEIGIGLPLGFGILSAEEMTREERSSSARKKEKLEVHFDSDDNEPIGSLLKLKKSRKSKRVKLGLDDLGEEGRKRGASEEKPLLVEDLGGMDDTLASFKRKLKGPKRERRSSVLSSVSSDAVELLEHSAKENMDDRIADSISMELVVEKGQEAGGDGSHKRAGKESKGRAKRPKFDPTVKLVEDQNKSYGDDSKDLEPRHDSLEEDNHQDVPGKGPGDLADGLLEDSISSFFRGAQSGDLGFKQKMGGHTTDHGCSHQSDGVPGDFHASAEVKEHHTAHLSMELLSKNLKCTDRTCLNAGSASDECDVVDNEPFSKNMNHASSCIEEGNNSAVSFFSAEVGPSSDACGMSKLGEEAGACLTSAQVDDVSSAPVEKAVLEMETIKHGLKHCSMAKTCTSVVDINGSWKTLSVTETKEETYGMGRVESTKGFTDVSCGDQAGISISRLGEEIVELSVNDRVSNVLFPNTSKDDQQCNHGYVSKLISCEPPESRIGIEEAAVSKISSDVSQSTSDHTQPHSSSRDTSKGTPFPSRDYTSTEGLTTRASLIPSFQDEKDNDPEDNRDSSSKDTKLSAMQRLLRKVRKHRHGDMAYEGDAEWETLMDGQGFLENHRVGGIVRSYRSRGKPDLSSNGGAVAVSVGLRARAAGPFEKIQFKEFLKRKGSLHEYLDCRNWILSLWSKDASNILSLADCGVAESPSDNEPARASLIREIYVFLDQNGYINTGVSTAKQRATSNAGQNDEVMGEKDFEKIGGVSIAPDEQRAKLSVEPDDEISGEKNLEKISGVSFAETVGKFSAALGQFKSSETCMEANGSVVMISEESSKSEILECQSLHSKMLQSPCDTKANCLDNRHSGNDLTDTDFPKKSDIDVLPADQSSKAMEFCLEPAMASESVECPDSVKCISNVQAGHLKCSLDAGKKIIVIGAGPAGLTAARHLHRQGFSVTVLEARSRLGGRVHTDRSSLSVPVDLGASIITGVEADMDTERRPDPSSLICSQLGLKLTVLNSDCPLYDIVTGQKVPTDLDETLEAEYNSLLDDMVLVVAQNGERAMQMSLEDGLEYALRRRRMAQVGTDIGESELQNSSLINLKTRTNSGVPDDSFLKEDILSPLERRVMNWHFAHLEYGCAALLKEVSLPHWNQDDIYGGFGGAHCMIKGGYSTVIESLAKDLNIHLNHIVTDISYSTNESGSIDGDSYRVKVSTSNGNEFLGDAVLVTVPLGCLKAETIKFHPPLPQWKQLSIKQLGFGVLNKIVLEFTEVFWDDTVDYFGATAEETNCRGQCFMFWNVKKTVGAPVLIALLVGKAALDGQCMTSPDHVGHAVMVLRKLFGEASVPDPVASVVTDWGRDPFSYGAYSYVAIGASGADYDILGKPVDNCLFFGGEATCKEHPDTVGGAMMSGLREAVRIMDILSTGNDNKAEVEATEAAQRQSDHERDEVRDIIKRLEAVEISNYRYKNSLEGDYILSREGLLQELFFNTKATAGRLHVAKALLRLPVEALKSFAGTKEGLSTLNSWILDSMGKDGTQLLRHCVRLLVLVSTDLLAVRLSGIGKTVKEKVCVHTSRDIRAIASQLVHVWLEVFRKEKASLKSKSVRDPSAGRLPVRTQLGGYDAKGNTHASPSITNVKKVKSKSAKLENDSRSESNSSRSRGSVERRDRIMVGNEKMVMSEEEKATLAAAEAASAAALAAAEAYASSEAKWRTMLQLPKIPSFNRFARREQYAQMDESELQRKWPGGVLGRQDCISEIDSRNCRVRDWSVDFPPFINLESSRMSAENLSHQSHSNDIANNLNFRENSGESVAVDSSIYTQAWVNASGSVEGKDYHAIERWQSQAAAAESDAFLPNMHVKDEEDSNSLPRPPARKRDGLANESSLSQITVNKDSNQNQHRGADRIKQAVVDYVGTLLMPLYKARKIDREGYKSIMKKTATKVMEQATDKEKAMLVAEFLDFKRRNKIRAFVDKLIEKHMAAKPVMKP